MKYFALAVGILLIYLLGQFSVEKFAEEKNFNKNTRPSNKKYSHPKTLIHNTQNISNITNNVTNIEEKTENNFHVNLTPEKKHNSTEGLKLSQNSSKRKTAASSYKSFSSTESSSNSKTISQTKKANSISHQLITFQSIGSKMFKTDGLEIPGIYTFFHLNLKEKAMSLKWLVSFKGKVYTRTVNYSSTKNGSNRAILFIDRNKLPESADSGEAFLSKLKVEVVFIINGKELTLSEAKIGTIEPFPASIKLSPEVLKTRLETQIKLSDNYNPIIP